MRSRVHFLHRSSVDRPVRFVLSLLVLVSTAPAAAQVVVVPAPPPPCATPCPACPPVGPCPPCPPGCRPIVVEGAVSGAVVVESGTSGAALGQGAASPPPPPPGPVAPAPGTLELGYLGGTDGSVAFHGGALRATGHLEDVYFLEVFLGGTGTDASASIWEAFGMLGLRIAGAVVPNVLRLFGALDVGLSGRGQSGAGAWGAFASELGFGVEVGLGDPFTVGFFTDVRFVTRVPFEREPAWIGVGWSAGLAVLWF